MAPEWSWTETSRHQDHVVAHILGTTALGYFASDQAAHLLLDIGFIWTIFVDGEMGLLTQSLAIKELELDSVAKAELMSDVELLHVGSEQLSRITPAPAGCLIKSVGFYASSDRRRILITGEEASLAVETSLTTCEIQIEPLLTDSAFE